MSITNWQRDVRETANDLLATYDEAMRLAGRETGEVNANELVGLRRTIAELMGKLGALANDPEHAHAELKAAFSGLRASLAEHQANWPAVAVREAAAEYRASLARIDDAIATLMTECRRAGIDGLKR